MQILSITIQILIGWFLFQILKEIKLTKCAIIRLERPIKFLFFGFTHKKDKDNKHIELFPVKNFGQQYKDEHLEELKLIEKNHIFTHQEIARMSTEEFIKNEPIINQQMSQGLL